jgi:hypothetical protein
MRDFLPIAHARWLADRIPNVTTHFPGGQDHTNVEDNNQAGLRCAPDSPGGASGHHTQGSRSGPGGILRDAAAPASRSASAWARAVSACQ